MPRLRIALGSGLRASNWPGLLAFLALLAIWEAASASGHANPALLPPPSRVLPLVWRILASGAFLAPLTETLSLLGLGYGIGCACGCALGLAMGWSPPLFRLLEPLIELIRPIPKPALIPPLFLFLGLGTATKVTVVALAAFFPVLINTLQAVRSIDPVAVDTARTFGYSRTATLFNTVLPASLPMILTSDLAGRVLKDNETFTMRKDGRVAGLRWWMPGWIRTLAVSMLTMDEPDHTRLRSIVDEAFRRRAILDMEPRILAMADELAADLFSNGSPADLVERYARRLPLSVICELLGLPRGDRPRFIAWANSLTRLTGPVSFLRMLAGIGPMKRYLEGRLQAARATGGEGLIAELVRVEKEGGRISAEEMVAMVFLLLGAGSETTTHLISGSVYELIKAPGLRDRLKEDWSRANLAIEEFLRFVSPVQFTKPRFVRRDVELGGVQLKAGDRIMAMLAAANMDPEANPQPEQLDLTRRPNRHLSFGTGIHFCLGHQLARIEGKCALEALFKRWPNLALAVPADAIRWRQRPGLRAIETLPVRGSG